MTQALTDRQADSANQLKLRDPTADAERIVQSLEAGLSLLVDRFYARIHFDVETQVGRDSLYEPLSEDKTCEETQGAIEVYQVVESAWAAREFGYPVAQDEWYLEWLAELRLGPRRRTAETVRQLASYQTKSPDARRKAFMNQLLRVLPESGRSPLVLSVLFPTTIHLATALAFGDRVRADAVRNQQIAWLPAIDGCHRCHGAVYVNGESCPVCGNPLWTYRWLTSTD
ncbi:MAG: hypothetical protein KJ000_11180 [Pirellulaceae bacterium]|nr:hypothetical protein [Pirellulaceae bacterium]